MLVIMNNQKQGEEGQRRGGGGGGRRREWRGYNTTTVVHAIGSTAEYTRVGETKLG